MSLKENYIHEMRWEDGAKLIPEKSVNLLILDPPYFEVKGDFDFVWDSMEDYLKDVEDWAKACKRVLAENGTVFVYGHAKKIAYTQIIFDKYFKLENALVWEKKDAQTRKGIDIFRCFAPVTERILMYSNFSQSENDWKNGNAVVYFEPFDKVRLYLRAEILKIGYKKASEIAGVSTRMIGHYTSKSQWLFPTKEIYQKLQKAGILRQSYEELRQSYEELRQSYEELRQSYEELRRPFNNFLKLTDVMGFYQEANVTGTYDHPTQKPPKLTRALILSCSRKGDLVGIPFAGSGVECAMAAKEKRRFIGFDIEPKYVEMGNQRCRKYLKNRQISILDFC